MKDMCIALCRSLFLHHRCVCVHASLRAAGLPGLRAEMLLDALLSLGNTVLVPTFSDAYAAWPLGRPPIAQNGWDVPIPPGADNASVPIYTPDTLALDTADMGVLAACVLRHPAHVRGNHPLNSFTAIGPQAAELVQDQQPMDVYAPLRALMARDGYILLWGTTLTSCTALHLSEQLAGRHSFLRWAKGPDGQVMEVQAGGCSRAFEAAFAGPLSPLCTQAVCGRAVLRCYPARALVQRAAQLIRQTPEMTHCGRPNCARCRDAVLGGPQAFRPL